MASSLKEAIEQDEYMNNLDKLNVMLTGYHIYQVDIDKISSTMSKLYEQMERIIQITKKLDMNIIIPDNPSDIEGLNTIKNVISLLSGTNDDNSKSNDDSELSFDKIEIDEKELENDSVEKLDLVAETKPNQWDSRKSREMAESGKTEEDIREENDGGDNLVIDFEKDKNELISMVNGKKEFWEEFKKEFGQDSIYTEAIEGDEEIFRFDLKKLIAEIQQEEEEELGISNGSSSNNAPVI